MISESVLTALGVHITPNGDVVDIPETDPNYKHCVVGITETPIYVLDYTREYDDQCKSDVNQEIKGFGHILTWLTVPYPVINKPRYHGQKATLNIGNCVRYAIDFCHARVIGGQTAFLVVPDDEHAFRAPGAGFNQTAGLRRVCDIPYLVDNLYYTGVSGALRLLNRLLPNRTMKEAKEFVDQLSAALEFRTDLHFERENNVFCFKNNYAIRIDVFATDPDKVIQDLPPIRPEDNILAAGRLPVNYNPCIPDSQLAIQITEGWSDTYKSDKWWRNVELNFATLFLQDYDDKGVTINIGAGGAGMTSMNKLRKAIFTDAAIKKPGKGLKGLTTDKTLGGLVNTLAYVVDDLPVGPLSNETLAAVKSISTGEDADARMYYTQDTVSVGGFAIIINSNHFPEIPQREARRNAIARRFHVCQHHNVFDDASIDNPADRTKRPDLIAKLIKDEDALSCVLNWTLEAAARVIIRKGYTPVEEDIAYARRNLGEQDIISDFFEMLGGVYGEHWSSPRLYHIGINDECILFPCWYDDPRNAKVNGVLDTATDHAMNSNICVTSSVYPLHLVNETQILHKLYTQYCKDSGSQAMNRKNFKVELCNSGFSEIRVVDPFGRYVRLIVPAGTPNTAAGFREFLKAQHDSYFEAATGTDIAIPAAATTPDTLSAELSNIISTGDSRWSDVDAMAHDAGDTYDTQVIAKWLKRFNDEDMTIDELVAKDPQYYDHEAIMAVLKIGIRAVQLAHGFDEMGAHHVA